jgi:voltage-gated potassium channel Kch
MTGRRKHESLRSRTRRWLEDTLSLAYHDLTHRTAWAVSVFSSALLLGALGLWFIGKSPLQALYGSLQLFGVNGNPDWLGPRSGSWAVTIVAFVAPFITLSILSLMVARLLDLVRSIPLARRNHVVMIGGGRVGLQWVKAFQSLADAPSRILVIDPSPDRAVMAMEAGPRSKPRCIVVQVDARSRLAQQICRWDAARAVVVCTGQDVLNVELARSIAAATEVPKIYCRVDATDLLATLSDSPRVRHFSFNRWVAESSLRELMAPPVLGADQQFHLVLAGFGHFGQAVLAVALEKFGARIAGITVIDTDATDLLAAFRFSAPPKWADALGRATALKQNLLSAPLWNELRTKQGNLPLHVWLCTDNDRTNLTWAGSVRRHLGEDAKCVVVCRQTDDSPAEQHDIRFASFRTSNISEAIRHLLYSDPGTQ